MKQIKISIKSVGRIVLFEYESEDNTIKKTVERAISSSANLRSANLCSANLRFADLRSANLCSADLRFADLRFADLRSADLRSANLCSANLRSADLRSADLKDIINLPQSYINQCSRDILFIFRSLKKELPFLKEKLLAGEIDGTQYEGKCACLIGTLAKANGEINKVCQTITFYDKGLHNFGEQWFYQIKKYDTPDNNFFAKHVLKLINIVEDEI